jgi:hypothetical protein
VCIEKKPPTSVTGERKPEAGLQGLEPPTHGTGNRHETIKVGDRIRFFPANADICKMRFRCINNLTVSEPVPASLGVLLSH